jgi:hypothetical protein
MSSWKFAILIIVSVVLGSFRVLGFKSEFYQATAHLWVGILIGLWCYGEKRLSPWLVIALSILEVACFLLLPK